MWHCGSSCMDGTNLLKPTIVKFAPIPTTDDNFWFFWIFFYTKIKRDCNFKKLNEQIFKNYRPYTCNCHKNIKIRFDFNSSTFFLHLMFFSDPTTPHLFHAFMLSRVGYISRGELSWENIATSRAATSQRSKNDSGELNIFLLKYTAFCNGVACTTAIVWCNYCNCKLMASS